MGQKVTLRSTVTVIYVSDDASTRRKGEHMFNHLVVTRKRSFQRLPVVLVVCSMFLHVMIGGAFALRAWSVIEPIDPPPVSVSYTTHALIIDMVPPQPSGQQKSRPASVEPKITPHPPIERMLKQEPGPSMPSDLTETISLDLIGGSFEFEGGGSGDESGLGVPGGVAGGSGDGSDWTPPAGDTQFSAVLPGMSRPVGISTPPPEYPAIARASGFECSMVIRAKIDRDGRVVDFDVVTPCPVFADYFAAAVFDVLPRWRFKPATLNGVPVPVQYDLTIRFTVR